MYHLNELLKDQALLRRLEVHASGGEPLEHLRSLKLKITSSCNLRCVMCKYWRIPSQRLGREEVLSTLESAASLGCAKVHFSGGEVSLHPDLPEFIRRSAELGMRASLTTNGILLSRERAASWMDAGLRAASFSLDGSSASRHDRIRGVSGAFKRTLRGIRHLKREAEKRGRRFVFRINHVLMSDNLEEHIKIIELAGELGAVDVIPMPVDGEKAPRPDLGQIQRFNKKIAPRVAELRRRYSMPLDALRIYPFGYPDGDLLESSQGRYAGGFYNDNLCYVPYLHSFIAHTGEVFACCMARGGMQSLGSIKTSPLASIFLSSEYETFRTAMRRERLPICAACDMYLSENRLIRDRLETLERVSSASGLPGQVGNARETASGRIYNEIHV